MFSGDKFVLVISVKSPEDPDSFYKRIFTEVKGKCKFDKVEYLWDQGTTVYNCPNALFDGKTGFTTLGGEGLIFFLPEGLKSP